MKRQAFTLVELVTIMGVLILISGITLPLLRQQKEDAKTLQCQTRLRTLGIAMQLFADRDPMERYCSGAPNFLLDGSPDAWGWTADAVNSGAVDPTDNGSFCPASNAKGSLFLNQLYQFDPDSPQVLVEAKRLKDGIGGEKFYPGTRIQGPDKTGFLAGTRKRTAARSELIARWFANQGYNTNYTASWFLVRSAPKVKALRKAFSTAGETKTDGLLRLDATYGPLTRRMVESSHIAARRIPFLGCGAVSNRALADFGFGGVDSMIFANGSKEKKSFVEKGSGLAASFTRGPAIWNADKEHIRLAASRGESLTRTHEMEKTGKPIDYTKTDGVFLQDTRDWRAWHGSGKKKTINLLYADGSVRRVVDQNGDGYLNPGFAVNAGSMNNLSKNRFTDPKNELEFQENFSGTFLRIQLLASFGED